MQILNELMKIKNGRGERVRLILETFLPFNDPAMPRILPRPAARLAPSLLFPRGGFNTVSSPARDLLGRTSVADHEVRFILAAVIARDDGTSLVGKPVAARDYHL